jgi:murein DD-endopeptidase MepM/ murein hydrolase activator NlpD
LHDIGEILDSEGSGYVWMDENRIPMGNGLSVETEGFMTLPFKEGTDEYKERLYRDTDPAPDSILDHKGGTRTYDGHNGTDFFITKGTEILAGAPGMVTDIVFNTPNGGNYIYIKSNCGNIGGINDCCYINYGHLGDILVTEGQYVKRGDLLAYSGSGGRSPDASKWTDHLHYAIWIKTGSSSFEPIDF